MKSSVSLSLLLAFGPAQGSAQVPGEPRLWTPAPISSGQYESSPTFTPDGREMYFFRSDPAFRTYRLLMSRCESGEWSTPVAPPFAAGAKIDEADPFVTADGKRLYYVSSRTGRPPSEDDDLDIWYVDRKDDAQWSEPMRLPEPVNSPSAELLPRALPDGRLLFGSSRPGGFGQGDIYFATPHADGTWSVENLGPPVSTSANEYEAEISHSGDTLVVVADRGDRSHLYRFTLREGQWVEVGRVPARPDVFQVGPLLSPEGDRLLFAQAHADKSGELFLVDLAPNPDRRWPPQCPPAADAR